MKINGQFVLRQVAGTWVVLPLSQKTVNFNGVIRLNGTGAFLWQCLERECEEHELVTALIDKYNIGKEQAETDLKDFLQTLMKIGCLGSEV